MVYRLTEVVGSASNDTFFGSTGTIHLGLLGNDTFNASIPQERVAFIGGNGNDTYRFTALGSIITIADGGGAADVLHAPLIPFNSIYSYAGTIDGGQHLLVGNLNSGQQILFINWTDPSNDIETVNLADRTVSTQFVRSNLTTFQNYVGDFSWEEAGALPLGVSAADMREAIVYYSNRARALETETAVASVGPALVSASEGQGGTTAFSFVLTLDRPLLTERTITWTVIGSGQNPASGDDFVGGLLPGGVVTFAAGETSKAILVPVASDMRLEPDEGFQVRLTARAGITLGAASADGIIRNDDFPLLSVAGVATDQREGTSPTGAAVFSFVVTRTGDLDVTSSANWSVAGSGTNPANAADFVGRVLPSGTVEFAPGETAKTINVRVARDGGFEADETFTLALSAPVNGTVGTGSANAVIRNDDAPPTFLAVSRAVADRAEGTSTSGVSVFTFNVARTGDLGFTSSVNWSVAGRGANPTDGADFQGGILPSGRITFAPGETFAEVKVRVTRDSIFEADEGFVVALSAPENARITTSTARGIVRNDDTPPAFLSIAGDVADRTEGTSASGVSVFTFNVTRTGDLGLASSANWSVAGRGANPANAADFLGGVLPSGVVDFAPGEASAQIKVRVNRDSVVEANERFAVSLSDAFNAAISAATAFATIRNDDAL